MDLGTILVKTDKGRSEVSGRSEAISPVQRRLLILVDGRKTVNDLDAFVRVGELEPALQHLLVQAYVQPSAQGAALAQAAAAGFAAQTPAQPARPATHAGEFARVRQEAAGFIRERLGEAGRAVCTAIERSTSPQELRLVLRGIENYIQQRMDHSGTQAFARHFGAMLL